MANKKDILEKPDGEVPPFNEYGKIGELIFSTETINSVKNGELTFKMWAGLNNEELKSAFATFMEQEGMLFDFLRGNLSEMDTFVNERQKEKFLDGTTGGEKIGVYTRYVGNINDGDITYVRCYCPSSDRMFFLCTENLDNAKDAIASLCEVPVDLYSEILEIYRQGEIFNFKLTEKGYQLIDSGKVDYNNKRYLTGDEYFEKMRYEY